MESISRSLRNTITFTLLAFYLTGFCGLNLVKHICYHCQKEDLQLVFEANEKLFAHHHDGKENCSSSTSHEKEKLPGKWQSNCCSLEFIYLKNSKNTVLQPSLKTPKVSVIDALPCPDFQNELFHFSPILTSSYRDTEFRPPVQNSLEFLCTYLC